MTGSSNTGVQTGLFSAAASVKSAPDAAMAEIAGALAANPTLVMVFHSVDHDAQRIAELTREHFPAATTVACSTMGEVGPHAVSDGGVSAVALSAPCRVAARLVSPGAQADDGQGLLNEMAGELGLSAAQLDPKQHLICTLNDGLTVLGETLQTSLWLAAPDIPLVGGSAGDDFRMQRTWVSLNGKAQHSSCVAMLIEPGVVFRTFAVHHFNATETRLVVTRADPPARKIFELNGWPAHEVLSELLDMPVETIRATRLASAGAGVSFGQLVGGEFFMRSVLAVEDDGSLLMGGMVEEGVVLRVMRAKDLPERTSSGLRTQLQQLGVEPAGMLLFNCGGRTHYARVNGQEEAMRRAMALVPAAGFTTYGEQFGPMHVNETLTGLLLGRR